MSNNLDAYAAKISAAQESFVANSAARASVGKNIAAMAGQIKAVNDAIKEVQNISMQVKMLSLNASVEAARAGAAGKGFAVVATEIGRLSQNTDTTVKRIEDSVRQLQELLAGAVHDMDKAKGLGAGFEQQLSECVTEAQKLARQSGND